MKKHLIETFKCQILKIQLKIKKEKKNTGSTRKSANPKIII